ncbi:exosortase family protein XrtF [Lutibacter sp. HS1-25]|uniref:exosortase family protein XrtF n=1 Tax=Lutibacter sp. HS1-25 TaxID=2485000 RepID=UPI0010130F4C|nr:exosortase family protein XrtF [Lutibacter sp. HS1-25]RXP52957.1 exosortase family protein XrtF [Lutibacter sp. HS1-25]
MKSNKLIVIFLIKFFGTYALLFLMYSYYLKNTQKTGEVFACSPITKTVAKQTVFILNNVGYNARVEQHTNEISMKLFVNNAYISRVIEGCNAISIIILFISFIVAFSNKFVITALYILFGSLIIYFVNIVRIAIISIAYFEFPQYETILHDLVFPSIIYGITFLLWFIWVRQFSNWKK